MARGRSGTRLQKYWEPVFALVDLGVSAGDNFGSGTFDFAEAKTILRYRASGLISLVPNAATDHGQVTIGLGVFSTDAVAAGAGALPDPNAEQDWPWMWWHSFQLRAAGTTQVNDIGIQNVRYEIDTKAMRKVKPRETLALVYNFSRTGTPTLDWLFAGGRFLVGE